MSKQFMSKQFMFNNLPEEIITEIRQAWQTGTPLGNDLFKSQVEQMLKVKVGYTRRGRPRTGKGFYL